MKHDSTEHANSPAITPAESAASRIFDAQRRGDVVSVMETMGITTIVIAPQPQPRGAVLLKLAEGAARAATTERVLRDAIRAGELPAFGKERDRSVRLDDLERWVESRRVTHAAIEDADLDRRMRELRKKRGSGKRGA